MPSDTASRLREFYDALLREYGPQHWWPGDGPVEIIVGAILTQNTNWRNVERALENLRAAGLLSWRALRDVDTARLADCIRPAGYYNRKAHRLKHFVHWLWEQADGDPAALCERPTDLLREGLLSVSGIGPETADSILLYALERPTFVVDAYTARVLRRHGMIDADADYQSIKQTFEENLPADAAMFNEYHALLVAVGKRHCKPAARCAGCPLERFPHEADAC